MIVPATKMCCAYFARCMWLLGALTFAVAQTHESDYSWLVRIVVRKTGEQLCVGNLVSEHFIMSPVSCYRRWSTLPREYYTGKELLVVAGWDNAASVHSSQERPGILITAHTNYTKDPHNNNMAILEVDEFDFDPSNLPFIPFLPTEEENTRAVQSLNNDTVCHVPTFKQTKYLRNLIEDSSEVRIVPKHLCWAKYCPRGHKACLPFFESPLFFCAQFLDPQKRCSSYDVGAPIVCAERAALGVVKICRENRPMIFQGFNFNIVDSIIKYQSMSTKIRTSPEKYNT